MIIFTIIGDKYCENTSLEIRDTYGNSYTSRQGHKHGTRYYSYMRKTYDSFIMEHNHSQYKHNIPKEVYSENIYEYF